MNTNWNSNVRGTLQCVGLICLLVIPFHVNGMISKEVIEGFVNGRYSQSNGWYFTISNYAPSFAFKDMASFEAAKKNSNIVNRMKSVQVSQCKMIVDFDRNRMFYSEQRGPTLEAVNFTNRNGMMWGRIMGEWWMAQKRGFQVLQGSVDGSWYDRVANKTNRFFASNYENAISFFKLGFPEMRRETFRINGELGEAEANWIADTIAGNPLEGTVRVADDYLVFRQLSPDGANVIEARVLWTKRDLTPQRIEVAKIIGTSSHPVVTYHFLGPVTEGGVKSDSVFLFSSYTNADDVIITINKESGERSRVVGGRVTSIEPARDTVKDRSHMLKRCFVIGSVAISSVVLLWLLNRKTKKTP